MFQIKFEMVFCLTVLLQGDVEMPHTAQGQVNNNLVTTKQATGRLPGKCCHLFFQMYQMTKHLMLIFLFF
jgi:hypothetical protein